MTDRICRCAHRDVLPLAVADCQWPAGVEVTWYLDANRLPAGLDHAAVEAALAAGIAAWPAVCGVQTRRVVNPGEARVFVGFGPIDYAWGILGQTELPCSVGPGDRRILALDSDELWSADFLRRVVIHEFGHALGLGHAPSGSPNVMAPVYNDHLEAPQVWDIAEAQRRYGPPAAPAPALAPAPAPELPPGSVVLRFSIPEPGDYEVTFVPTLTRKRAR